MSCVVMMTKSKWWIFLQTKSNLNVISSKYMYLLNGLHYITLLILNIQVYCWHQVIFHLMLCLTHFFQMPENRIPPLQLQTVNASLKYRKTYNNLYEDITISENTKSCAEKYRCETEFYLMSMLSHHWDRFRMHEILKLDFFSKTSPGTSAWSEEHDRTQIEFLDRKIDIPTRHSKGAHILVAPSLTHPTHRWIAVNCVHQLEDATSFPLMVWLSSCDA